MIGGNAIWLHVDREKILLETIGTILVLFVASMIGIALAGPSRASRIVTAFDFAAIHASTSDVASMIRPRWEGIGRFVPPWFRQPSAVG